MRFQQKTFLVALMICATCYASAQVTAVRRYNPSGSSQTPQTYSTEYYETADAAARREKALAKVQGRTNSLSSKGLAPAQYSTDGFSPVAYGTAPNPATTFTVNGINVERNVRKGAGQEGDLLFTPIIELHYVQFAVYCKNTPVDKAPPIEGLMLLWHEGSKCPGGEPGACYIVKGYNNADEAKAAVLRFKGNRIDCWYNPALTGAAVEVIGIRS
ncbi:MAG: hypothetical protein ACKVT2_08400 [Saprospiraceae bacterium]